MKYKGMASYNTTSDRERRNVMSLGVWEGGGGGGWRTPPHMKGVGMLFGNFE